jgi:glycosyltransferase involved in cell wall biosynthesis
MKPNFIRVINQFINIQRRCRFNIIQTFFEDSIFVTFLAAKLSFTHPVLLSSRRDIGLGKGRPWYHRLYRIVLPIVNLGFDGIIANSENVKTYVVKNEKTVPDKIKVIYNGISLPDNSFSAPPIFKDNRSDFCIGIVASLTPVKRLDTFLKSLAIFRDKKNEANFCAVILGEGPEREHLLRLADKLNLSNSVFFTGAVKNVHDYLVRMDVGVLSSDREGLSNAILEYMACSLPVVATAVGGNRELVDESNGFCVPPNDPEAIANALIKLYENPELGREFGRQSLEKIRSSYSWEKSISGHENYYRSLVNKV